MATNILSGALGRLVKPHAGIWNAAKRIALIRIPEPRPNAKADDVISAIYSGIGGLVGGLGAIATFLIVLLAAVDSVGWVIGLVLGWIIGLVAGAIVFWIGRYLWPVVLILAIYIANHWQRL